jgi:hypothetical protein
MNVKPFNHGDTLSSGVFFKAATASKQTVIAPLRQLEQR